MTHKVTSTEDRIPKTPTAAQQSTWTRSAILWLRLAAHPATVRRACVTALIVGFVLVAINHGSAIIAGKLTGFRVLQICLTVIVPYVVSTVSSVATRRELSGDIHRHGGK